MPAALKYLTVEGQKIAYRDEGRGPALVFLHGLGGNSASWEPQFEAFADRYRLVAWDMPGFGSSDLLAASEASTRDYSLLVRKFMAASALSAQLGSARPMARSFWPILHKPTRVSSARWYSPAA